MTRSVFALFWVALAGLSGFYLFTVLTDPSAAGGQSAAGSQPAQTSEPSNVPAPAAPAPVIAAAPSPSAGNAEIDSLKGSLQDLSQQLSALDERLKPIERFIGPVAALPPSNSVSTSPPAPPEPAPEPVVAAPEPAPPPQSAPPPPPTPQPAPAAETVTEEVEAPVVETPPPPPAPPPVAVVSEPAPLPEPAPEPPAQAEAAAAPQNTAPASEASSAQEETQEQTQGETEIAALDPVTLPPAANDGSTRYGIEIGSVAKRDELRPLWREYLTKHAALVAGLQPRRVLAPDNKWRLIAGPFANAQDAEGACSLFKRADRPCAATVYAGDAL